MIDLDRLQNTFLEEASEHLLDLERGLLEVEEDPSNLEPFQGVFRAAHSIKGGSGVFGFETITRLTHALESVLDRMRNAELEPTTARIDVLLRAVDQLGSLLDDVRFGRTADRDVRGLIQELTDLLGGGPTFAPPTLAPEIVDAPPSGPVDYRVLYAPHPNSLPETSDPMLLLRNLAKRGTVKRVEAKTDRIPLLEELEPTRCYLSWEVHIESDLGIQALESVFEFSREFCDFACVAISPPKSDESRASAVTPNEATRGSASPPDLMQDFLSVVEPSGVILDYLSAEAKAFLLACELLASFPSRSFSR